MYGLIFENFSGYIKVGVEEHKYIYNLRMKTSITKLQYAL